MPKTYEIYTADYVLRQSTDRRPCVLLNDPPNDRITVAAISSAAGLFDPARHFLIDEMHADFPATGLVKTSYVLGDEISELELCDLRLRTGEFKGDMLKSFREWIG